MPRKPVRQRTEDEAKAFAAFQKLERFDVHPLRLLLLERGLGNRGPGGLTLERAAEILKFGDVKTLKNTIAWRTRPNEETRTVVARILGWKVDELFPKPSAEQRHR